MEVWPLVEDWRDSIDNLTIVEMGDMKARIMACLSSARTNELREKYADQLAYLLDVKASTRDISLYEREDA